MARLTRAQQQERTRAAVLVAAWAEFAEHGYADAKVDRIAERAELTRGAVYSNFTGKRALYLAVLADAAERSRAAAEPPTRPPGSVGRALGAFARVWLERLPLVGDTPGSGHLQLRSLSGVLDTEPTRAALAELVRFEALLLALSLDPHTALRTGTVRLAELALTLLHGAAHLAENAPGAGDPFDVARAAEHLAGLALAADDTEPAHLPYTVPARATEDRWTPPPGLQDAITGRPVDLGADGVIVTLGVRRLSAAEEAMRSARLRDQVTFVVVTGDPAETGRLARLRITDLAACLRRVFPYEALPRPRIVLDEAATIPRALGDTADDSTETAVRLRDGLIVARAEGRGAGHAAAAHTPRRHPDAPDPNNP